jgi:hypothetical protein
MRAKAERWLDRSADKPVLLGISGIGILYSSLMKCLRSRVWRSLCNTVVKIGNRGSVRQPPEECDHPSVHAAKTRREALRDLGPGCQVQEKAPKIVER